MVHGSQQERDGGAVDVAVVGGGPAAYALAGAIRALGAAACVVDPDPQGAWPATYGAWTDELPPDLPDGVVTATLADAAAIGTAGQAVGLGRDYAMLSTGALAGHLRGQVADVLTGTATAVSVQRSPAVVTLDDGRQLRATVVVDATGARRVLTGGTPPGTPALQTAVGVVLDNPVDTPLAFMDWQADHGKTGWPTFLYAVPLGGGRVLLEETSLARRPALPLPELHERVLARLGARGISVPEDAPVERVSFVVDTPVTMGEGPVVPFGAAAPLIHPATGYSLATTLGLAPAVATAIVGRLPDGMAAATAARRVIWSPGARAVHHLRRRGLEVLLALPPDDVGRFFDRFFALPDHHRRAYLSSRDNPREVMAAMAALFRTADADLRRHLLRWGLYGRAIADDRAAGWHHQRP